MVSTLAGTRSLSWTERLKMPEALSKRGGAALESFKETLNLGSPGRTREDSGVVTQP